MSHNNMSNDEFPDEVSLRFRLHVLCVYAQSILALLNELTADGPDTLDEADRKAIDERDVAIHSCFERFYGLPRRFAPRNDGLDFLPLKGGKVPQLLRL